MIQAVLQHSVGRIDRLVSTAILLREAARTSRRWQTFAARTGFSAALIAVLLLGIHGAVTATGSSLVDSANLAWLGRGLFIGFAIAQLGLSTLLAPLMTATAVIEESEQQTLDLLVLTKLDAGQIIAGKVVSRLLVLTTVVLGSLPITALVVNLGGVSGLEVVAVTVHTLTTVALMGLLGAFFALFTRSPMLCVMASASYAVPFFLVLPGAYALTVASPSSTAHFSPFAASMATDPSALLTPLSYLPSMAVLWGLLLPLFQLKSAGAGLHHAFSHEVWQTRRWLVALGVLSAASLTLLAASPICYMDAASTSSLPWPVTLAARAWVWLIGTGWFAVATWAYLRIAFDVVDGLDGIFHPRRKPGDEMGPIDVGTNPVWWREARFRAWSRTAAPILSTWLLVLMGVFQTGWWMIPGGILAVAIGNAVVAMLLAAWMGCRAVAEERRRGTLEVLLTTTMGNGRIVMGKAAGVCFATLPLLLTTLPLLVLGVPHMKLWNALGGDDSHFLRSTVHAALTWAWLLAVWATVIAGSLVAGVRVRNPRSAFGMVMVLSTVFLMIPAAMGRLFPEAAWVAVPARWWAPPLAGGAGALSYLVSTMGWGLLAVGLLTALTVRLRAWSLRVLLALATGAAFLAAPEPAHAQPDLKAEMERLNMLRMAAVPVADGLHRQGGWVTVSVVLENTGPATKGTLSLDEDAHAGTTSWSRRVELAEGSRKELSFVFRATGFGRDRTLTFLAPEGRTAVASFRLQPVSDDVVTIGVMGRDALGLPAALRQTTGGHVPGHRPRAMAAERSVRTGLLLPGQVPTSSVALGGLDWIVWPDADPSSLEAPQVEALASWVADGGQLLLTVTDTHRQLNGSPLVRLLPAEIGPPEERLLGPLTRRLGVADTPTPVASLVPLDDSHELVRADDGSPLWLVRAHGLGAVHLIGASLSLDPLEDADREELWRALLFLPERGASVDLPDALRRALNAYEPPPWHIQDYALSDAYLDWEQRLRSRLDDIPGVSPLPLSWLVMFSMLYLLVIGPLDYLVLRALKRQPFTWVTFPATIVLFTGLAIVGTRYTKGSTAILTRVELIDVLPDADRWRGETFFGVFSTRKVDLMVQSGFDDGVLAPLQEPGYLPDPSLRAGQGPGSMNYRAETWTLAYGRSSWTTEASGQIDVERVAGGLRLRNDLGVDLEGAAVLVPEGGVIHVGELAVGEEAQVRFDQVADPLPDHHDTDEGLALHLLGAPPLPHRGDLSVSGGQLVFVGWASRSVEALRLTGLSPQEDPLLVVRQPLPGPSAPITVRERRLIFDLSAFPTASRVEVTCLGGEYGYIPPKIEPVKGGKATVVMDGSPQAPCDVRVEAPDNTWFGTVQQTEGSVRCHESDYTLECEALP